MSTIVNPGELERMRALARGLSLGDDADDLVSEVVLEQLEGRRSPQTDSYERHGLRLRQRMQARAQQRRRRREAIYADGWRQVDAGELETLALALREALTRLDADDRALLIDRFVEGRSADELAEQRGLSPAATRQRVHRALARLRHEFEGATPQRRSGLFVLGFGGLRRRRLGLGLVLALALPATLVGTCVLGDAELDTPSAAAGDPGTRQPSSKPPSPDANSTTPTSARPDANAVAGPDPDPEPTPPSIRPESEVPDLMGAAYLALAYPESSALLRREVQTAFIECVREYNQVPPKDPPSGRAVFQVQMRHSSASGSFVEAVEVVEDSANARDLVDCVREGLPIVQFDDPALRLPPVFRVVVDLERLKLFIKGEVDLVGLPVAQRQDSALLDRLAGYLVRDQAPPELVEPIADLKAALADGVVAPDELAPETLAAFAALAASP